MATWLIVLACAATFCVVFVCVLFLVQWGRAVTGLRQIDED